MLNAESAVRKGPGPLRTASTGKRGEDPGQPVVIRASGLLADDLGERDVADPVPAKADHFPRILVCQLLDRRDLQAGREYGAN